MHIHFNKYNNQHIVQQFSLYVSMATHFFNDLLDRVCET